MNKKILVLTAFLLAFVALLSSHAHASSFLSSSSSSAFDVSIDRVRVNGKVVAQSKTNLIDDADVFSVIVDFTTIHTLENSHVEATLRGKQSNNVVADSTSTFNLAKNSTSTKTLTLTLIDRLKRETEFELTIKIADAKGRSEQKTFGLKTKSAIPRGALDVSIDRVKVNSKVVSSLKTNFIEENDNFNVLVEFTSLEDLEDAHVEAILKDLMTGFVVSDATSNFDLSSDSNSSKLLRLELLDRLKKSDSFELTVKIIDAEGNSAQKTFGLGMRNGISGLARGLDISIDSVEVENKFIVENENNFVVIGEGKNELDLRLKLTALEDIDNARVDAILTFENGDVVADTTATFDIRDEESTIKKLELPLITAFEQNSFKLKIKIIDAEGDFEEKLYGLKISQKKFPFIISSIALSPESNAEAGKSIIARLRFKNSGVLPLEGVTVKVSIPELGISSTKFFDQIKNSGRDEVREDFVLKILDSAQTGAYTVKSEIFSQFGSESEVKEISIFILGKDEQDKQTFNDKLLIKIPVVKQDIKNDGSEALYQLILTNAGPDANAYTLLLDGANWASLRLAGSNAFVLKPKESKAINIYASTKETIKGEQKFAVTVKSNDKVLKELLLTGDVIDVSKKGIWAQLKDVLVIFLISAVVLLAAVGIFFGIRRYMQGNGKGISEEIPNQAEGEAYY